MKSSKRTSVNLNRNTVDIVPPVSSSLLSHKLWLSKRFGIAVCLTVVVFSLLVKLGFWQLERGQEKQALEQALLARADAPYQSLASVLDNNDWREESVIGVKVQAEAKPEPLPVVLLDNQTFQGKVGYLAYQVVSVGQDPITLALLELGFVEGLRTRDSLPTVTTLTSPTNVTGRLYRKSMNPLSSELMPEMGEGIRVQNLNISELNELLNVELMPAVLQPDNLENWAYPFPWNPLPLTSSKHFGYAVQWFVMAGVFLLLTMVVCIRWFRKAASQGGEA
ncbi:TPA: SURF1 family protein [Vibrio parahaemolyticus]|uniref:SURF1 family protein n=1 Tax=Vibrio parahaemolyticus TaxID=670 RepID=UPI0007A09CBA|nr:SURF1 family protein [Vibrio parahaemolyticus]EIB6365685.1 SURF1 family protein [Vibrio parahaemolyticus]EIF5065976.1 SURF1 family protein [Vibrio parahaemolyticus]EII3107977.1 SURF1 family protein [Vibrio parahaemolyticus]EII5664995.1 SURF1 family protein [Vibrio parahaemolyticus]EIM1481292.1 SURF1 family protein [Vibrio parahaemolyticus]